MNALYAEDKETDLELKGFLRFISPASFRVPVPTADHSPWTEHAPFVSWLIDTSVPRRFVDLSDEVGAPYAAICQSVVASATGTQCYAVDPKSGDGLTGPYQSSALEKRFLSFNTPYQTFSRLVRVALGTASDCFDDGSIDLIHIDMNASYERLRSTIEEWSPKLSGSGIILLHNVHSPGIHRDTARFWDEWKKGVPHFEFPHAHGLAVIAAGSAIPPALLGLVDRSRSRQFTSGLRNAYARLGASLSDRYKESFERLTESAAEADRLRAKLEADLLEATRRRDELQDALQRSLARTSYVNALLGSQAFRLEQAASELERRVQLDAIVDKDRVIDRLMNQSYMSSFNFSLAGIVDREALLHRLAEQAYFGRAEAQCAVPPTTPHPQAQPPGTRRPIVRRLRALAERVPNLTKRS